MYNCLDKCYVEVLTLKLENNLISNTLLYVCDTYMHTMHEAHMHVHADTQTHACIHTHTHTHTHTHYNILYISSIP